MIVLPVSLKKMKDQRETFFIELYILELRTGITRIAATDEDITFDGEVYHAVPFKRESITRSMDNIVDSCQITLSDCDESLLKYVMDGFDFRGSMCTILRIAYPDSLSDPTQVEWVYSGSIDEPSFADATFSCKLNTRFPQIECPNRSYQLACNSEFGDAECGMSLGTEIVQVLSHAGNAVTISKSYANNYWKDGVIQVEGEARIVEASSGTQLTLNVNFLQDDLNGKSATLTRGCNKSQERCRAYNNLVHYGGFPAVPFESMYR